MVVFKMCLNNQLMCS